MMILSAFQFSNILKKQGFLVREAENGIDAFDQVKHFMPGLILLDLIMPKMDGFEFLTMIKANEELNEIPIVVITSKSLSSEEKKFLTNRVVTILQKGEYTIDEFRDIIDHAMSTASKKLQG